MANHHIENEQHCYYRMHQGEDINGYAHQTTSSRIRRKRRTITNDDDDEMIVRDFLLQGNGRTSDTNNLESPRGVDQLALVAAAGQLLASHQGIETDETTNLKTQLLVAAAVQPRTIDFQQDVMAASGTKAKRKANANAGEELLLQLSQHAGTGTSYPFDCDRDEAVVVDQQRRQRRQQQQRDDLLQFQDQAATAAAAAVSQLLQQESQQYGDFQSSIGTTNDRTTRTYATSTRHSQQQQRRQRQQQRTRAVQAHAHVHHDTLVSNLLSQQVQQQQVVAEHPFQQVKRRKKADEERRRSEERRLLRQCSQFVSAAAAASSSSSSSGGRLWSDDTVLTRRDLFKLVTSPAPSALNGSGLSMSSFRRCNSSITDQQQQHQQPLRYFNNGMEVDHHGRALHTPPSRRHYRSHKNGSRVVSSSSSTAYTTGYRNRATTHNRIVAVEEDGTSLATAICLL